jgi:hypothetical protein
LKSFRFALLMALGTVASVGPASAWPYIDVTASEVLSVDPPRVRTTFEVSFVGYGPGCSAQFFEVSPLNPETLHIFECGAPPSWDCGEASGGRFFNGTGGQPLPLSFSIVTDQADPCVRIVFFDPVLARAPSPTVNYDCVIEACLLLDAPVPAQPSTWGSVKSRYR